MFGVNAGLDDCGGFGIPQCKHNPNIVPFWTELPVRTIQG
jgi:hypothetical protein